MDKEPDDYLFDFKASQDLAQNIRRWWARRGEFPNVWVEKQAFGFREEKPVNIFVIRSDIKLRVAP